MGPGPLPLAPDLEPAAVDLDDRQGRSCLDARLEGPGPESVHPLIAIGLQLLAGLVGDAVELSAADGHLGQVGHRLGRLAEGGLAGGTVEDLADHRGAVIMGRQPQGRTEGGKNPGGRPGNDTWARDRGPVRPRS